MTRHTLFLILKSTAASVSSNTLIVFPLASPTVNIGLDVDSTCMFGSYPLKKYNLLEFVENKMLNGERAFILNR